MQSEFESRGVVVVGITRAPVEDAQKFWFDQGLNYPILADAQAAFDAYGVKAVWGSVVYLIDENEKVVARGIEDVRKHLASVPNNR